MPAGNFNQSNVSAFWFRDGNTVLPGKVTVDELRVGTDWASVTPAAPRAFLGDFNYDGKVDAGDYATWRKNEVANATLPNDNGLTDQSSSVYVVAGQLRQSAGVWQRCWAGRRCGYRNRLQWRCFWLASLRCR